MPAEVKVEEIAACKKRLKIQVPKEDLQEKLEEKYSKLLTDLTLPGFRKGRVPRKLVEKRFGDDVKADVKQNAMSESVKEALEKNALKPIGEAKYDNVEFDVDKALTFEVTFEVMPTFELSEYKGLKLNRKSAEPADEDVYNMIQEMRRRASVLTTMEDAAAEKGDVVICDYEVRVGDQVIASATNAEIAADGMNVMGIPPEPVAEMLIASKSGDKRSGRMKLTPEFGREELRGKEAEVNFTVKEVKRAIMPEVDEAFAKKVGYDTLKDLNEYVRERVKTMKENWVRRDLEMQACDALLAVTSFELPADIVKQQTEQNLERRKIRLLFRGISAQQIDREKDKLQASSEEDALRSFRLYLILDKVAEKEKVYATEDDVEKRVRTMAMERRVSPAQLKARLDSEDRMSSVRSEIRHQKVLDLLLEKGQITDVKKTITAHPEEEQEEKEFQIVSGATKPEVEEKKTLIITPAQAAREAREGKSNEEKK